MLKINVLKRSVALLLSVLLLINCLPLTALAETTTASTENEEEYIYYSDLFYAYSYYLTNAPYLSGHYTETQGILDKVYTEFMDSPQFDWTNIKNSLAMATNLKEWTKMITDASGLTSFTYEKALDAANVDFATQLTGGSEIAKAYGTELKWVKKINDILKVYDTFDKNYDISVMTETEVFTAMFATIEDSGVLVSINKTTLTTLQEDILPHISSITSKLSKGADILTAAKTIATGIMMEDFRLELIDEILQNTSSGTMLYDGMYRLKNQLRNGFVSYFMDQYLTEKVLNEIADKVVKKITSTILEDQAGAYAVIGAITKVASWIVFDCIFDVPDIDDLTKQMVLSEYSVNLYDLIGNKLELFNTQFETDDIYALEALATAYAAATNAALDASDKLKLSTNASELATISDKYSDISFYYEWIESVKNYVKVTSVESRKITDFGNWKVSSSELLLQATDHIEQKAIYAPRNGLKANIYIMKPWGTGVKNYFQIPSDVSVVIDGDIIFQSPASDHHGGTYFVNNGNVKVTGNIISHYDNIYSYIENNGLLEVEEDIDVSVITMAQEESILKIGGNLNCASTSSVKNGTVIFDGSQEQAVNISRLHNIEVVNLAGIKYLCDITFYGCYKLNNNPLNCGNYFTNFADGAVFGDESDYKNVKVGGTAQLTSNVKANIYIMKPWGTGVKNYFQIPSDVSVVIDGDIIFQSPASDHHGGTYFVNNGNVKVTGNIISHYDNIYSYIENNGLLEVEEDIDVSVITMAQEESILKIGGNLNCASTSSVKNGTVIFDGREQQMVNISRLAPKQIKIMNTCDGGVIFTKSVTTTVLFDHHGNKFTLNAGGTFVDYDGDGMKDNVDPEPTVGNPCTLYFKSDDAEKGSVSLDELEIVGGTEITVTATPNSKYNFVKWVNSTGATVSTSAKYKFVAKNDDTYTAVFTKRQRPIITQTDGGTINVPAVAEIESEVSVTVTENAGYVYTEGSLTYNNIPVENGSFIMPDEAVIVTAEFVRNKNYFLLSDMISVAKSYTYESYSAASFSKLTSAIAGAEVALVNNITAEDSENHISMLWASIDGLQEKYITTVALETTPTLYINVPDMINDILVLVTYDNGTTITVAGSECTIVGYDSTILGEQSIIVEYGGVSGVIKVDVQKRLIAQCIIAVNNQVYDGVKEQYTPTPIVSYIKTGETLTENVDFTLEYKYHTEIGTALVIVTGIGNYTGRRIAYFDIYCEHNYECNECVEPTCIQTGYKKEKCTICGESKIYTNVVTEGLPESEHNYANNSDVSYTYTDEGAYSLILAFSNSTLTESSYDKIYIYNGEDTLVGTYSGSTLAGKTITVQGDTVRIRLTSDKSVVKYGFSLDSITAYFDRIFLPTIEHIYGEWSTATAATPDAVGTKHKLCTECGNEITEEIPMLSKPAFKGASLSLHHNLAINYKVDKALFDEVGYTKPYVVFEIGEVKTIVTEYTIDNERYVFKFQNIAPNQMNDVIYATLYATYNGVEYASETREYSVAEYCYSMLDTYGADEYAELRTLLVDLLHYGAQSQLYTDYNTASLADAKLTDEQLLWGTNEEQTLTDALNTAYETVENPTAKWKGAGLTLTDSVSMRFKFTSNSIDGLNVKIKSATDEWVITSDKFIEEDGVYYVYFNGLNAGQMSEKVYLTIYDGDVAVSNTVCYSIESYAYEKQNSSIAYLSDLVKAMMRYGNSAYAYVN